MEGVFVPISAMLISLTRVCRDITPLFPKSSEDGFHWLRRGDQLNPLTLVMNFKYSPRVAILKLPNLCLCSKAISSFLRSPIDI